MKTVILTVGPQGSGKSTYCDKVATIHPDIILLSRDKLLNEMFGDTWLDPYCGGHYVVMERLFEILSETLGTNTPQTTILLDCWNGSERERHQLLKKLRDLGAEKIIGWYFVTPLATTIQWFLRRECSTNSSDWEKESKEHMCRHNYQLFHEFASDVRNRKEFDIVRTINPLQRLLFPDTFAL